MLQYGLYLSIALNLIILLALHFLYTRIKQLQKQNAKLLQELHKLHDLHDEPSEEDIVPLITDEQLRTLLRATIKRVVDIYPQQKQEASATKAKPSTSQPDNASKSDSTQSASTSEEPPTTTESETATTSDDDNENPSAT